MAKHALSALLAQKAALDKQIADIQHRERSGAVMQVKTLMAQYGLSLADISASGAGSASPSSAKGVAKPSVVSKPVVMRRKSKSAGKKVAAKYRNAATGDSWSGRGLKPKWLTAALATGRQLSDFAV